MNIGSISDKIYRRVEYLLNADENTDVDFDDLHSLFGASCALAELRQTLPGKPKSSVPLKLVLDRRPFI